MKWILVEWKESEAEERTSRPYVNGFVMEAGAWWLLSLVISFAHWKLENGFCGFIIDHKLCRLGFLGSLVLEWLCHYESQNDSFLSFPRV